MCTYRIPKKGTNISAIPNDIKTLADYHIVKRCGDISEDSWEFNSSNFTKPRVIVPLGRTTLLTVTYKGNDTYNVEWHDEEEDYLKGAVEAEGVDELATVINDIVA